MTSPATRDDATGVLPGGSAAAQRARLGESTDEVRTAPVSRTEPTPPAVEQELLLPGTVVDRYILVEHLGSGGLGDVYKAYDPELDRRIAIKVLRSAVVQAETRLGLPKDRLRREAQALAKLHHPNVVAVHDVGEYGDESFIAMGFAEGLPLHRWAVANDPSWSRVRDVFLAAGRGLAAAHAVGLVHRDFKPENVVVGPDDSVVVLDFGLARAATVTFDQSPLMDAGGDSSLLHSEVTGHEVLLGTPAYMAPELFRSGEASHASDQFAFCVALYKTLFGDYPFPRASVQQYIEAVERGQLAPPGSDVPRWLLRVLARGMASRPEDRYANIESLMRELEGDRTRRRNRRLSLALAVPLLGLAIGAAAWLYRPEPTAEELAVSETMARAAREAAARGDFVYPPADDPEAPTALSSVLALEDIEGPAAEEAGRVADELRDEFSGALIKFGDRYFDMEGGRSAVRRRLLRHGPRVRPRRPARSRASTPEPDPARGRPRTRSYRHVLGARARGRRGSLRPDRSRAHHANSQAPQVPRDRRPHPAHDPRRHRSDRRRAQTTTRDETRRSRDDGARTGTLAPAKRPR